jgi:cardiolipin synthase
MDPIGEKKPDIARQGNEFRIFTDGDALYEDMFAAIHTAQRTICLESYIFANDRVGGRFIELLCERARAGVSVRLHIDAFGSLPLMFSTAPERLRTAGVALQWFNPPRPLRLFRLNRRNHRKLLVVDERFAWLGGFNIHEESSRRHHGDGHWRDTHVRMGGELAGEAAEAFDRLWRGERKKPLPVPSAGDAFLVTNHNLRQTHRFRRLLKRSMRRARQSIWLATPYFMPDAGTQRAMARAAKRGIDVRLLVPFKTDRPVTQWAARAAYARLLAAGVRIYEFQPRILHAKTAVVDGHWSTVGTANLDYRSFYVNFELNLISTRIDLARELARNFRDDLAVSEQVTSERWRRRGLRVRITELVGWLARKYL